MLEIDMGVQGAKRSRYFPSSPDALLRKLVESNPRATETELEEKFEEQVLKYGGNVISAIIAYWFANRYRALVRELEPTEVRRERVARIEMANQGKVEAVKRAAVTVIARTLLTKIAPGCGKRLSDMTKTDCQREGGWYLRLADKLNRRQTVSQAGITNEELWELFRL